LLQLAPNSFKRPLKNGTTRTPKLPKTLRNQAIMPEFSARSPRRHDDLSCYTLGDIATALSAFLFELMAETQIIFERSPEVVAATVGEKSFLLHVNDWVYLELNESGSRIWELLGVGKPVEQVVEDLGRDFNVDRALCASDTSEFLELLEAKHFVVRQ
jgi:hypothetical protein